jgi:hypothetical protein
MPIPLNQVTVAEISVKGQIASGGSDAINTNFIFHYRRLATSVDPDKTALKVIFKSTVLSVIAAALNQRWTASLIDIRWVNDATDPYLSITDNSVGAIAGDSLQSDDAAYLLHRTALRGRKYRGSKHLAPFSESDVTTPDEDIWNAACLVRLAAINTALTTTLTDTTPNSWKYTILSRTDSQIKTNPTTVVVNDVTSTLVNKRIGRMKRRYVKSVY